MLQTESAVGAKIEISIKAKEQSNIENGEHGGRPNLRSSKCQAEDVNFFLPGLDYIYIYILPCANRKRIKTNKLRAKQDSQIASEAKRYSRKRVLLEFR